MADGGYAAALLLDGWALLGRPDLRAAEETLRRWLAAAALVRPAPAGGRVVVLADVGAGAGAGAAALGPARCAPTASSPTGSGCGSHRRYGWRR